MLASPGRYPGFALIRLVAATTVFVAHAPWLTTGRYDPIYAFSNGQTFLGSMAVCAFFVVSGFLVTESLLRSHSLWEFSIKRALRIFPALAVAVVLCACLIGPLFTNLPLGSYFTDRGFFDYFLNIFLQIRLLLPGVFTDHVYPFVNGSLWTIRYEVLLYVGLGIVGTLGLLAYRAGVLTATVVVTLVAGLASGHPREILMMGLRFPVFDLGEIPVGAALRLAPYFLVGVSAYLWRDFIRLDGRLAVAAGLAILAGLAFDLHDLLFPLGCGYLCIYLGLNEKLDVPYLHEQDYSYGIYVYSFPIQQVAIVLSPVPASPLLNIVISTPIVALAAILSWNFVERPALRLKHRFTRPNRA